MRSSSGGRCGVLRIVPGLLADHASRGGASMLTRPDRSVLLVLAALGPSDPSTWIVDDDGGPGVFTTIQGAVDAASPGDLVWVRDGTYDGFLLSKGLTIRADGSARPRIVLSAAPSVAIELVPPGERVELRGFEVSTTLFSPQHSFESLVSVSQCQGPILLADLLAIGSRGQAPIGIAYCGRVTLLRVVSRGFRRVPRPLLRHARRPQPSVVLSAVASRPRRHRPRRRRRCRRGCVRGFRLLRLVPRRAGDLRRGLHVARVAVLGPRRFGRGRGARARPSDLSRAGGRRGRAPRGRRVPAERIVDLLQRFGLQAGESGIGRAPRVPHRRPETGDDSLLLPERCSERTRGRLGRTRSFGNPASRER